MKLVLKNKQEIEIAGMNNSFSFEKFKDGKGNELSYNSLITMYVGENETFESVKKKLSDGNDSEFTLTVGKGLPRMESGRDYRGSVRQRKCDHNKTWSNLKKGETMRKIIVEIEREKAEYIERLNFELGFAKDVIQRIIESHPNDPDVINSEAFKAYQKKGAELEAEYKLAVQEIEKLYIPGAIKKHKYNWMLPNNSTKLEINIMCNCEIEGIENEKN